MKPHVIKQDREAGQALLLVVLGFGIFLIGAAGLAVETLPDRHVWAKGGRLRPMGDTWSRFDEVRKRISKRGSDMSFADFLSRHAFPRPVKELARMTVEDIVMEPLLIHGAKADATARAQVRTLAPCRTAVTRQTPSPMKPV